MNRAGARTKNGVRNWAEAALAIRSIAPSRRGHPDAARAGQFQAGRSSTARRRLKREIVQSDLRFGQDFPRRADKDRCTKMRRSESGAAVRPTRGGELGSALGSACATFRSPASSPSGVAASGGWATGRSSENCAMNGCCASAARRAARAEAFRSGGRNWRCFRPRRLRPDRATRLNLG